MPNARSVSCTFTIYCELAWLDAATARFRKVDTGFPLPRSLGYRSSFPLGAFAGEATSEKSMLKQQTLVQAAVHDARILPRRAVRRRGAYRRRRCCGGRGRGRSRDLRRASLNRCCRSRRFLLGVRFVRDGLAVRNELRVAWSARPRRRIDRQPAGPMRPMVGDKAPAAPEIERKSDQSCRSNEPLGGHKACRMFGATISQFRSLGMDRIRGGTMVQESHAL